MRKNILRSLLEVSFIIFLFYSNLLMGEFVRSAAGQQNGLIWALGNILTAKNFIIAVLAALIGHFVFEHLIKRTQD